MYSAHVTIPATMSGMHVGFVALLVAIILVALEFGALAKPIQDRLPEMDDLSTEFWTVCRRSVGVFHWKTSNGVIVGLWGAVVAMAALGATLDNADYLFNWAYGFAILSYSVTLGAWFTSRTIAKEHRVTRQQRRRGGRRLPSKTWAGSVIFTALFFVSLFFVSDVRLHKELQSLANRLYPGSEEIPVNGCPSDMLESRTLFLFGNSGTGSLVKHFPHTIVSIESEKLIPECLKECSVLSVGRNDEDSSIYVVMDVRDKDNKVIVQLDDKGFHINPNNYYEFTRSDRSSLSVKDQEGNTVLDIHYLNPKAVKVNGTLYIHGKKLTLATRGISNSCTADIVGSDFALEVP